MQALAIFGEPDTVNDLEEKTNSEQQPSSSFGFFWMLITIFGALVIVDLFFNQARVFIWLLFFLTGGYDR